MTLRGLILHVVAQVVAIITAYGLTAFVKANLDMTDWGEGARFVTVLIWVQAALCAFLAARALEGGDK
jgi:hypothetical protein